MRFVVAYVVYVVFLAVFLAGVPRDDGVVESGSGGGGRRRRRRGGALCSSPPGEKRILFAVGED